MVRFLFSRHGAPARLRADFWGEEARRPRLTFSSRPLSRARFFPTPAAAQAEDPVDNKAKIEADCHKPCGNEWKAYEACAARIKAKGDGTCEPWSFDYIKCVDKCVRPIARARARAALREIKRARCRAALRAAPRRPLRACARARARRPLPAAPPPLPRDRRRPRFSRRSSERGLPAFLD